MRSKAVLSYLTSPLLAAALAVAPLQADAAPAKTAPAKKAAKTAPAEEPAEGEDAAAEETPEGEAPAEGEETAGEEPTEGEEGEEGEEGGEEEGEEGGEEAAEEEVVPDEPPPEVVQPQPEPEPQPEPPDPMADRPEEPTVGGKPRKGIGLMIAGGVVLAGGIASTITFAMVTEGCSLEGPLGCKHQNQGEFLIPLGAAITLLGGMLLAVGVGYHIHYRKWQRWTPADAEKKKRRGRRRATASLPSPTLLRDGAGLSLGGRF